MTSTLSAVNDNHVTAQSTPSSSSLQQKQQPPNDSDDLLEDMLNDGQNSNHQNIESDAHGDGGGHEDNDVGGTGDDEELEVIRARVREMEEEAEKLKQMQDDITSQISNTGSNDHSTLSPEERAEIDSRSIYVGNVDYTATADDLEKHFHGCGSINRVTILCDRFTGHPKGYAYIEFADKDSVETATALDESLFKGRQIKVNAKRTNRPGLSTTNRPPRGRGLMGRGRGGFFPRGGGGGSPWIRGGGRGGRGFRSRTGWYGYSPY
ncbi:polyadenylate-binding protein 2 isoform X2 [Dermatophagoides farinae]|uniref:Polyadenylate-binding protein 2 n=1 Tax=Dermatophagoides farinae TaxID=6954 RepID=A0A922IAJ6_DERFA|nr:polyadenylate-binding protein 2-like isoform X2 [Dermatophagoides farinae]KAH7636704.1 polyadenylate-binding protein 2-like protein [Dermatophagoides farinae]KAH9527959.1 Polyadenylate-binding protein 2 [Dermatophagoides farinae]